MVRVVTPGAILDEEPLEPKAAHYLCALARRGRRGRAGATSTSPPASSRDASCARRGCSTSWRASAPREILFAGLDEAELAALRARIKVAWSELPAPGLDDAARAEAELVAATGRQLPRDDKGALVLGPLALRAALAVVTLRARDAAGGHAAADPASAV